MLTTPLLSDLVQAIKNGEPQAIDSLLAGWIKGFEFLEAFEDEKQRVLADFDHLEPPSIKETNFEFIEQTFDEYVEYVTVPEELTSQNFIGGAYLQFIFEPDRDGLEPAVDIEGAVVQTKEGPRIGHFNFGEGD